MKRKILYGIVLCAFCALAAFVYVQQILPILTQYPFRQDFTQDYIGARALLNRADELYPVLGPAVGKIGIDWGLSHRSTHPPTAFLLAIPFSMFPYQVSQILWMIAMFACIVFTARTFGLNWRMSLLVSALSLAWPPAIWSLYQFTPIWLLGLALAYRYRDHPKLSGVLIAIASLPKFLAAPSLLYHLRRRKWSVLIGFGAVWFGVLALLFLLRQDTFSAYLSSNMGEPLGQTQVLRLDNILAYLSSNLGNSLNQVHRTDNGALLIVAWRLGDWLGLAAAGGFILWVLWAGLRSETATGWACLVWIGIALLPIAWVYSLLPLLPWLILVFRSPGMIPRILVCLSLLAPYATPYPTSKPEFVAISIIIAGITFAVASLLEKQKVVSNQNP